MPLRRRRRRVLAIAGSSLARKTRTTPSRGQRRTCPVAYSTPTQVTPGTSCPHPMQISLQRAAVRRSPERRTRTQPLRFRRRAEPQQRPRRSNASHALHATAPWPMPDLPALRLQCIPRATPCRGSRRASCRAGGHLTAPTPWARRSTPPSRLSDTASPQPRSRDPRSPRWNLTVNPTARRVLSDRRAASPSRA